MNLSPQQINDDAKFWVNQDMEHQLFFSLGIVDPTLKNEATNLYNEYKQAQASGNILYAIQNILPRSQAFKTKALNDLSSGKWIGWLYPLFIDHTKRELEYFMNRIQGNITPRDEMCLGNRFNAEHCAFAAHLLDPSYDLNPTGPQGQATTNEAKAIGITNACMTETYPTLLALSKNSASDIDHFFSGMNLPQTKSIIHPALAAHVVREGQRFMQVLNQLPSSEPMA